MAFLTDFFDPKSTKNHEKIGFLSLVLKITVPPPGLFRIIIVLEKSYHNIYSSVL